MTEIEDDFEQKTIRYVVFVVGLVFLLSVIITVSSCCYDSIITTNIQQTELTKRVDRVTDLGRQMFWDYKFVVERFCNKEQCKTIDFNRNPSKEYCQDLGVIPYPTPVPYVPKNSK